MSEVEVNFGKIKFFHMKKHILIGLLGGILFSVCIYSAYFFFSYAPRQHKSALIMYEQTVPIYKTFLECKKCEGNNKSPYDCAVEVMSRNNLGKFTDFEKYQKSQEELTYNRIQGLKAKCTSKSIEELKTDPYLLGSRSSSACESYTIQLNLAHGVGAQCERNVKEYCRNPETSIKIFTESEFIDNICVGPVALSDYRQAQYLKRGEIPPAPRLQDEYKKISNINTPNIIAYEISGRLAYSLGVVIPYWFILFMLFFLPSFIGVLIGILIARKKSSVVQ